MQNNDIVCEKKLASVPYILDRNRPSSFYGQGLHRFWKHKASFFFMKTNTKYMSINYGLPSNPKVTTNQDLKLPYFNCIFTNISPKSFLKAAKAKLFCKLISLFTNSSCTSDMFTGPTYI
ncbi:hypothetical protein V8G54_036679 [Vigna mungo]|uniref:Uncharacterized protein n=1 Tax=Vigna mungo TaxID=3915 RepID=A0AAQ3RGU4_VIGMU